MKETETGNNRGYVHVVSQELGQHLEMVTSLGVNVGQLGWLKFDVTKVVNSWYTTNRDAARDKLTLLVDCTGCGSHVYVSTFDGHSPHVIESSLNAKGTLIFQRASLSSYTTTLIKIRENEFVKTIVG